MKKKANPGELQDAANYLPDGVKEGYSFLRPIDRSLSERKGRAVMEEEDGRPL